MKIWFISDTHNQHDHLQPPDDVDLVIHCGDESRHRKPHVNEPEARRFFDWYSNLEIPAKIYVPGNHSTSVELGLVSESDYPNIQFLVHKGTEYQGLKIFGSPYTPQFFFWAYNVERPDLEAYWKTIPSDVDILITHGPPKGYMDVTRDWRSKEPIHIGSLSLTKHVLGRIKPRLHAFGHLHDEDGISNYGTVKKDNTLFVNCACCNLSGELVHQGFLTEL